MHSTAPLVRRTASRVHTAAVRRAPPVHGTASLSRGHTAASPWREGVLRSTWTPYVTLARPSRRLFLNIPVNLRDVD